MDKPAYYGILPANIRYCKNLSPMEKIMYSEITSLMQKEGYCYASNSYFAELYDVHVKTVSTWINNLKKYRYISTKIINKTGSKEVFQRRIYPLHENTEGYPRKDGDPLHENTEDNTININTTREAPTKEQVISKGKDIGKSEKLCIRFYNYYSALGWKRGRSKIIDYVPLLRNWDESAREIKEEDEIWM